MRTTQSEGVALRRTLNYKLFKGVSIQLENSTNDDLDVAISQIASQDNVKRVWPVRWNSVPNDTVIWTGKDGPSSGNTWKKRQLQNVSESYAPHVSTQVDRLHAEGVRGKGMKIAIIDTGIDWKVNHSLGYQPISSLTYHSILPWVAVTAKVVLSHTEQTSPVVTLNPSTVSGTEHM